MSSTPLGRDFRFLFSASTVSNLGDGVTVATLPLLVATLTRDPTAVAAITMVGRLPWLLFALPVGAITDRRDRREVMVRANLVRGVVMGLLAAVVAVDGTQLWMLYVTAAVLGVAEVFYDNAAQTLLPSVVAVADLPRANGRLLASELVANQFAGPPLGAALFAAVAALPFVLDAASFLGTVVVLALMAGPYRPAPRPRRRSLAAEIGEGITWLRGHALLRLLAGMLALTNFTFTAGYAVLVLLAQDVLGVGELGYGLVLAASAAGGLLGSLAIGPLRARVRSGPLLVTSAVGVGSTSVVMGLLSDPWAFGAVLAVTAFLGVVWNVITVSLRQTLIPDGLLGRVNSVYRFLGWGAIPLGALAGGVVADSLGLRAPYLLGGALQLAVALAAAPFLLRAATRAVPSPSVRQPGSS